MTIGIIGCGLIGKKRALAARELGLEMITAYDLDPSKAAALCTEFGGVPAVSLQAVLNSHAQIIVIAVTHSELASLALAAIQAGKHVLLEKPGARTAVELLPVAEEAKLRNLKVKVGFNHRFHPALFKARELATQGVIGDSMFIRGCYGHGGRPGYEKEWRFDKPLSGGGELLDQGTHLIDLSRWFLGEFTSVSGILPRCYWPGQVEDNCFLTLQTAEGKIAHLHASWTEWKNMFCLEIYGRSGKLQIDGLGGSYGIEQLTLYKMLPEMGPPETTIWQYPFPDTSWKKEMQELLTAISEDRAPLGDVNDAVANLKVTDCLYQQLGDKA